MVETNADTKRKKQQRKKKTHRFHKNRKKKREKREETSQNAKLVHGFGLYQDGADGVEWIGILKMPEGKRKKGLSKKKRCEEEIHQQKATKSEGEKKRKTVESMVTLI